MEEERGDMKEEGELKKRDRTLSCLEGVDQHCSTPGERSDMKEAVLQKWDEAVSCLKEVIRRCAKVAAWAKPISPTCAPTPWNWINVLCCIGTGVFLMLGLQEHAIAVQTYVPFNMIICILWLAEAALWILFDEGDPLWQKMGELMLATYYIVDGVCYYYEWVVLRIPPTYYDIIVYSTIDIMIYLFYFVHGSYPEVLTGCIPSKQRESLELPSWPTYKDAISAMRKFFVWWLPTAATLMWLTYNKTWIEHGELALIGGSKASSTFLATQADVGGSLSMLGTI